MELPFEVIGRSKSEKVDKDGHLVTTFKVVLQCKDAQNTFRLQISSGESVLLQRYPMHSEVSVELGAANQQTLTDADAEREAKKAEAASHE